MTAPYLPKPGDEVYLIPSPDVFGWAFSRGADPSNETLPRGFMLRAGRVFEVFADPIRSGSYLLNVEPGTTANPTGVTEAAFLSEMNYRWRLWAVANGIDPATNTDPADVAGPVWVAKGSALSSLADAAPAWQWTTL